MDRVRVRKNKGWGRPTASVRAKEKCKTNKSFAIANGLA